MNLKERLKAGDPFWGNDGHVFRKIPEIAKILKVCGFDFFIVDCEHGNFDFSDVAKMCTVGREAGIPPMSGSRRSGAKIVLKFWSWAPEGSSCPTRKRSNRRRPSSPIPSIIRWGVVAFRCSAPIRASRRSTAPRKYMKKANDETSSCSRSSRRSPWSDRRPLAVQGIDAAFVGPNDLSQSMGSWDRGQFPVHRGDRQGDRFRQEAPEVLRHHMMSVDAAGALDRKGMTLNFWANDVIMIDEAAKAGLAN